MRDRADYAITIWRDSTNEFRWRMSDKRNGEIVGASTEGYVNRSDCEHNLMIVTGWKVD